LIVEKKEKNRAISIEKEELNNLKRGRFSEYELEKSKNAIRMLLLNAEDSPIGMMDDINQSIELKTNYDIKKQVEEINEINKQDVISIINHWHLDTIYRSEEHTSELQSRFDLVCRLLLEKKKQSSRMSMTTRNRWNYNG